MELAIDGSTRAVGTIDMATLTGRVRDFGRAVAAAAIALFKGENDDPGTDGTRIESHYRDVPVERNENPPTAEQQAAAKNN